MNTFKRILGIFAKILLAVLTILVVLFVPGGLTFVLLIAILVTLRSLRKAQTQNQE